MRVLVVGGTLFIGRPLIAALLKHGHRVTILHRSNRHTLGRRVASLIADRNDPKAVREALTGHRFDIVFDNVYDWERGTSADQVLATLRACGDFERYIFMSSVAAYGDGLDHREDDPLAPDRHPNRYIRQKAMTERALFRLRHRDKLPVITLRPPFIYGPGNPFYREAFFWDRMRRRRPIIVPGDGTRLMQFVFVKDLVAACLAAMTVPTAVGQAFNVADSRPVAQKQFVEILASAAGKKANVVHVPRRRIEAAGGNAMGDPLYFGLYYDVPPITMQTNKFRRVLGVKPTPFLEGLKQTYRWYSKQKHPKQDFSFEDKLLATVASSPSAGRKRR